MNKEFYDLEIKDLEDLNGGALFGAVAGYLIGLHVGLALGVYAAYDSMKSGSSGRDAGKALLTVMGSTTISCTVVGAVFGA